MASDLASGGAVGAVLGGRGACGALKWELYVFLKKTIGFLKAGELPGASGREVLGSFGALLGVPGRPLGAGGSARGAGRSVRGALGELLGGLASSFGGSGDNVGGLGADFLNLDQNSPPTSAEEQA